MYNNNVLLLDVNEKASIGFIPICFLWWCDMSIKFELIENELILIYTPDYGMNA